jgi:serine/threonine protein kinase
VKPTLVVRALRLDRREASLHTEDKIDHRSLDAAPVPSQHYGMALPLQHFLFKTNRQIGEGGLGVVDEIEVTESNGAHPVGTLLALKRLGPQWAEHPTARARFEREIETLQAMQHPNIISLQGENAGAERFYCMPRCVRSYRDVLNASAPKGFEWTSVARLGIVLARALHYAHALGFVHRDLKPENLLLDAMNNIYIADWGVGYFIHHASKVLRLTAIGGGLGTAYYCCIEQWQGNTAEPSMDVYALGITLAELILGKEIGSFKIGAGIQVDLIDPTTHGARIMNALLRQMTAPAAAQRIKTMDIVANVLTQAINASAPGR